MVALDEYVGSGSRSPDEPGRCFCMVEKNVMREVVETAEKGCEFCKKKKDGDLRKEIMKDLQNCGCYIISS